MELFHDVILNNVRVKMIGDESDARISGVERRLSNTLLLLLEAGAMALNADAALMRQLNANRVFTMVVSRELRGISTTTRTHSSCVADNASPS